MNLFIPNPATQEQVIQALLAAVQANPINPPVLTVTPSAPASTDYTYVVVARANGSTVPGVAVAITNGSASLSVSAFNSLSWTPVANSPSVVYDLYRTQGGTTQGNIAAGLTGTTFVDNGVAAVTATAPAFNMSGTLAAGIQQPVFVASASGAIPVVAGTVLITKSTAAALTLALPIAGPASAGGNDGAVLTIIGVTAHAHTVVTPAAGINGADTTATYAAAGDIAVFIAYNGAWVVPLAPLTATLS